jgi:hypothetical protein
MFLLQGLGFPFSFFFSLFGKGICIEKQFTPELTSELHYIHNHNMYAYFVLFRAMF